MVTSETDIGQMAAALEAGANEYVMKPFTQGDPDREAGDGGSPSLRSKA